MKLKRWADYDMVPMKLSTEIHTSRGVIQCELSRMDWHGLDVVYVSLWQSRKMGDLDNAYTTFRSGVYMQWNGKEYKLIQPSRNPYNSFFWQELEKRISNLIIVNE